MPEIRTRNLKHAKVTFHFTRITEGKPKGNRRKTEGAMITGMFTEISRTLHGMFTEMSTEMFTEMFTEWSH